MVRAVCYTPKKRLNLQQAYQNKSPVKIVGVKSTRKRYRTDSEEYSIQKYAKITPSTLEFSYNDAFSNNLCSVQQALSKDVYETVDLKVKIMKKQEQKQVIIKNEKPTYKSDCIIADETQAIKLVLWEDCIDGVHNGKSYHFQNLTVRIFDDSKFINTNEATIITEIEDIKDINMSDPDIQENLLTGDCIAIQIKSTTSCVMCNTSIDVSTEDKTITCQNCNITTLSTTIKQKLVAQMVIKTQQEKILKFTCFNDGIQSFLKTTGCQTPLSDIPIEELKTTILQGGQKQIIADQTSHIISQFLPLK